jgi:hypothetical protein
LSEDAFVFRRTQAIAFLVIRAPDDIHKSEKQKNAGGRRRGEKKILQTMDCGENRNSPGREG